MRRVNKWVAATMLLAGASTGWAQAPTDGAQKALARAQYLLRQQTAEKTALQQQLGQLQQQLTAAQQELAKVRAGAGSRQEDLQRKLAANADAGRERDRNQAAQLAQLRGQLAAAAQQEETLEGKLETQKNNFKVCYANNRKLLDVNQELVALYENKGVVDALKQREPVTGLRRVEVENLVQDYRYKLEDLDLSLSDIGAGER